MPKKRYWSLEDVVNSDLAMENRIKRANSILDKEVALDWWQYEEAQLLLILALLVLIIFILHKFEKQIKKYKIIILTFLLGVIVLSYPLYNYIKTENVVTEAAEQKLKKCKNHKEYSLSTYLKERCPEFLYYIKYCDSSCEKKAIKEILNQLR